MMAVAVELQQLCLPDLTGSTEFDGQRRFKASTCHTPEERHRVLLTTSLVDQDILPPMPRSNYAIAAQLLRNK